ncbi:MAG: helix-turn-helix transcriptional regulator [Paludibacteraceae bacterium]|nr:helix-turn-helix transcriptional regulator [Paludibacteraceae bacterium]
MNTNVLSCYQNKRGASYFELCAPDGNTIEIIFDDSSGYEVDDRVVDLYKKALAMIVDAYYKKKEDPLFKMDLQSFMCIHLIRNGYTIPSIVNFQKGIRIEIGAKIRNLRMQKGIEAKKLAACVGIDAAHLSRIEQGKISVGIDILGKIANALRCSIDVVPLNTQMFDSFPEYREKRTDNEPIVIKHGNIRTEK